MICIKFLKSLKKVKKELHQLLMNGSLIILFLKTKEEQTVFQIAKLYQENLIDKNGINKGENTI